VVHRSTDPRRRFEALFDELYEPLQRYARRRTDPDAAQDVVSEALLVVWRRLDDVPVEAALPWAYRVTANCLANARRSARRRQDLTVKLAIVDPPRLVVLDDPPDPDVHAALAVLGETDQEIVRLWAWEGLGPADIAEVLDLTPNAVSIRLHRAKARLADELRKISGDAGHDEDNREEVR
jgi:RNA polymerase sigma-70 factor (ECF subfamily)